MAFREPSAFEKIEEMGEYKVGGLSSLFSSKNDQDSVKIDLFKSRVDESKKAKVVPAAFPEKAVDQGPKAEGKAAKKADEVKKRTRKRKKDYQADEDEDEEEAKPRKLSRRFQVRQEDKKEKKLDPEKEARTIFVGNLPSDISALAVKKLVRFFFFFLQKVVILMLMLYSI